MLTRWMGESDPLLNILQTGMLKMKPRERVSAHECLKRVKTDLFSNDNLDIGGATQTEKTALWGEIANRKSSITVMAEALQSQKSAHLSKTRLQKTALQHNVA